MKYPIAEKFKSIQGEGLYTGTPMAFIRFVGCSVGQGVCTHCDTDFDRVYPNLGGGMFSLEELQAWAHPYEHICLTGGEPLDRDLLELVHYMGSRVNRTVHIETSGTVIPEWLDTLIDEDPYKSSVSWWLTVSPKPGWQRKIIPYADEFKVILGGLGDGPGWPTLQDALELAKGDKPVFLQPRNRKFVPDHTNLAEVFDIVCKYPKLRLSTQFHKYISVR